MLARRLVNRSRKPRITAPATAAARNHNPVIRTREIMHNFAGVRVVNNRPDRNFEQNVFALAAVAAGRPSAGNELLPAEGEAAVAAVSGLYPNCGLINKHNRKNDLTTGAKEPFAGESRSALLLAGGDCQRSPSALLNPCTHPSWNSGCTVCANV